MSETHNHGGGGANQIPSQLNIQQLQFQQQPQGQQQHTQQQNQNQLDNKMNGTNQQNKGLMNGQFTEKNSNLEY